MRLDAHGQSARTPQDTPKHMALTTLPVEFGSAKILANLSTAVLVEMALARGEGQLAANGALQCDTGERTGRSPDDKFLEDSPAIHNNINCTDVSKTNRNNSVNDVVREKQNSFLKQAIH